MSFFVYWCRDQSQWLFHLWNIMRVSALFLINETATVIDPCINIRKTGTYYIYMQHISLYLTWLFWYILLNLRGTAKTKAMNKGDAWMMEWTKDTYATCCVKMLKITRFSDQHFRFFKLLRILYLWNPIQFEIFFMFNRKFKPSMQKSFT